MFNKLGKELKVTALSLFSYIMGLEVRKIGDGLCWFLVV
jgi:hypothetical protein